jgi:signal transduction histidine kinase/CheY-like chemotaxis protein/PAS domain-containing protein
LQKQLEEAREEIRLLKARVDETQNQATFMVNMIQALNDIHIFCCREDENNDRIVIFNEGKIAVENNTTTANIKGKKLEEIIGDRLHSELKDYYDRAFCGEVVKYRGYSDNGRYFSTILTPFTRNEDGTVIDIIGNTQDITEIYRAELESQEKTEILKNIIEHNPYSIQVLDADGHHVSGNKAFVKLFHQEPPKEWSIFSDPFVSERHADKLVRAFNGDVVVTPPTWYNAHLINPIFPDNPICIGSVLFPVLLSENKIEYIIMHEDITARVLAEEELIKAKEKAESADQLKSAFLANMSHEIRTPMNGILGFAELLKTQNLTGEKQQKYIRIIEQSGERMLNIINDLITISTIDSGQLDVVYSETNLNEQFEFLYNFFELEASQKGLQLEVSCPLPNNQAIINTDREKALVVLRNLIKNAIKFTISGSIKFGYQLKGNHFEFFVEDTGIGINPNKHNAVFERFVQADSSISNGHEGSGLGLSIAKEYIEMLGGKIWMKSEVDKGTQFYFTIPDKIHPELDESISKTSATLLRNELLNATILIAEDDDTSLKFLSQILEKHCYQIIKVTTGDEAVEICKNNNAIDLVLMDIKMPVMNGHIAAKQIKEFRQNLPIIAQTAFALEIEKEKYSEPFDDYITKPFKTDELKLKIINLLRGRKS